MRKLLLSAVVVVGYGLGAFGAAPPQKPVRFPPLSPNSAREPLAKTFSLAKGAQFLDAAAVNWTQGRKCGTCHTNVPYLMARPALKEDSAAERAVRKFFQKQVEDWESGARRRPREAAYSVVAAVALAMHDARTTGKLHPTTRKGLDRIWKLQNKDGAWDWIKCDWPPLEHDDYYGAVLAAVGVGHAPDKYASSEGAKAGLAKLKSYLRKNPAPNLHHKAWLMWASLKVDGLMSAGQRKGLVKELLRLQRGDGGWSLPSLGDWQGYDGRDNDVKAPSDGYGTGFVVFALRQAGLSAKHPAVRRGVGWLKANQRASGRWFTRSLNTDRAHFITHAGTAFALLALKECE
jgi:squalene-hopene/tetraprenyl-beta-curcumene cyclase